MLDKKTLEEIEEYESQFEESDNDSSDSELFDEIRESVEIIWSKQQF